MVYGGLYIQAVAHILWQSAIGFPLHGHSPDAVDFTD